MITSSWIGSIRHTVSHAVLCAVVISCPRLGIEGVCELIKTIQYASEGNTAVIVRSVDDSLLYSLTLLHAE